MKEPVPEVVGDFIPLRVTFDHEPHVICVGDAGGGVARVQLNGHFCSVHRGRWVSPPIPYRPGMEVVARFIDGQGNGSEVRAELPGPDRLGPVFGPCWTGFAPGA